MVLTVIKKHLIIYRLYMKYGFILATVYRFSFFVQIFVELGYQVASVTVFWIYFSNASSIAGWSFPQMLVLNGINIIFSGFIVGGIMVFNLRQLPRKIKDGDIDLVLVKPINSLFQLSLGMPYFTGYLSCLPGFGLIAYGLHALNIMPSVLEVLMTVIVISCGCIIGYSIFVMVSALAFKFINLTTLPRIAERILFRFTSYPHDVYQGVIRSIFTFVLPVVFMSSVPASFLFKGVDWSFVLQGVVLSSLFLYITIKFWNRMILYYSSASS